MTATGANGAPSASGPLKSDRLFVTPQMQPQVLNLQNMQGIPQQFIQVIDTRVLSSTVGCTALHPSKINLIRYLVFRTVYNIIGRTNSPECR